MMMMMIYNLTGSRILVAKLGEIFGDQRFDEYSVITKLRPISLQPALIDRKRSLRANVSLWLRWAASRDIGLSRDRNNPTWFRVQR
jgi:hypothetical protein